MHNPFTTVIRSVRGVVSRTYSLVITMLIALIIGATGCKENSPSDQEPQKLKEVDLGLSVRWASMNLGAEAEEDAGNYYAWGDIYAHSAFYWDHYTWRNSSTWGINMYNQKDGITTLWLRDDAAHDAWEGNWRMPTESECAELIEKCEWQWTTCKGVSGYRVTGPSRKSIFLPVAGHMDEADLIDGSTTGCYWSSSVYPQDEEDAWMIAFSENALDLTHGARYKGLTIRPVCE